MARYSIEHPKMAPEKDKPDEMLSRLATRGLDHEEKLESKFREEGQRIVNVESELEGKCYSRDEAGRAESYRVKIDLTLELLRAGTDVVAQATLEQGSFRGYADFLVKVPGASALGDFHYEVWDTKLARRIKPGMVLQLCCYVDMLESIQHRHSSDTVVALGNGVNERLPLVDCFDYYLAVKQAFLSDQENWKADLEPDPALHTKSRRLVRARSGTTGCCGSPQPCCPDYAAADRTTRTIRYSHDARTRRGRRSSSAGY